MPADPVTSPLVSVIVRTKNRPEFLAEALASIVAQHYRPIEVVVVNDGGIDISTVVETSLGQAGHGLSTQIVIHEQSLGRSRAANAGLDTARGDRLIFLDDDDWFEPEHIGSLVAASRERPGFLAAYAGVCYAPSPGGPCLHVFNQDYDPIYLMMENTLPIHAVLFDRRLLELGCRMTESLEVFEDWDFWLQCAEHTDFLHLDQISAGYRAGGDSNAGWSNDPAQVAHARRALLERWKGRWSGRQLDQALRWARGTWLKELNACQDALRLRQQAYRELRESRDRERESQERERESLRQALEEMTARHDSLSSEHEALLARYSALYRRYQEDAALIGRLRFELNGLHRGYRDLVQSTSWRVTRPLRTLGTVARKARGMDGLRHGYGRLREVRDLHGGWRPLSKHLIGHLRRNGITATVTRARFRLRRPPPPALPAPPPAATTAWSPPADALANLPRRRIGVQLHLFYPELFAELAEALNHIPMPYLLMVSVVSTEAEALVLKQRTLLNDRAELRLRVVPNRGRDIAPFLLAFAEEWRSLDLVAHLHGKRSRHADGGFGDRWRRYLVNALVGDERCFRSIMAQFEADERVGMIYPETFEEMPYWAHSWLANRPSGMHLLARMGVDGVDPSRYVHYPVGSMFWARPSALAPLLELGLRIEDFPAEAGQTDGTLQHALERCLPYAAYRAGYHARCFPPSSEPILFYSGLDFVAKHYAAQTIGERIRAALPTASVVSFDIFDTLIVRPFADPDALLRLAAEQIEAQFGVRGFFEKRKEAESICREEMGEGADPSLNDIYAVLERQFGPLDRDALMAIELDLERRYCRPREALIELAGRLRSEGRRVILVSDMYLPETHIRVLLERAGLPEFDALYLSNAIGLRKDLGNLWPYVLETEGVGKDALLHVGDNERSDVQILVDGGWSPPVHVMRPLAVLDTLPGGKEIVDLLHAPCAWPRELILGLIANRICARLDREPARYGEVFSDPADFGYSLIGPIMLSFMVWLLRSARQHRVKKLLFLSREGWMLEQLYRRMRDHPAFQSLAAGLPDAAYVYASRSFAGSAALRGRQDLPLLLQAHFDGTLAQLLNARFGWEDLREAEALIGKEALQTWIRLPDDLAAVEKRLADLLPLLSEKAKPAREAFAAHWRERSGGLPMEEVAIVDIGYSGTIHRALQRLLQAPLRGYYFVTTERAAQVQTEGGACHACFGDLLDAPAMQANPIHRYALVLEAVLTSPEGQLKGFMATATGGVEPVFKPKGAAQARFHVLEQIHQGAMTLVSDVMDALGADILSRDWFPEVSARLLEPVAEGRIPLGALTGVLSVEDNFSGNEELSVVDFYSQTAAGDPP